MKRFPILSTAVLVTLAACGGGKTSSNQAQSSQAASQPAAAESAAAAPAMAGVAPDSSSAPMATPSWFDYDKAANTVKMTITAGLTNAKNYWNFNGGHDGDMIITVPVNSKVTIDFKNADPNMSHSMGIVAELGDHFTATPTNEPVFKGAVTEPHTATAGVDPGKSQTLHFVADKAGHYSMICYMAGHAATGMWIYFNVSATGEAGVQTTGS